MLEHRVEVTDETMKKLSLAKIWTGYFLHTSLEHYCSVCLCSYSAGMSKLLTAGCSVQLATMLRY